MDLLDFPPTSSDDLLDKGPTAAPVVATPPSNNSAEEFGDDAHIFHPSILRRSQCIEVPQRIINMGMDIKFEDDPWQVTLNHIMTPGDYKSAISSINTSLESCRSNKLDHALFVMGPAMLPLVPWSLRQKKNKKKRRKIIQQCCDEFNDRNPELMMRWETRPVKRLTIMTSEEAVRLMSS